MTSLQDALVLRWKTMMDRLSVVTNSKQSESLMAEQCTHSTSSPTSRDSPSFHDPYKTSMIDLHTSHHIQSTIRPSQLHEISSVCLRVNEDT